jgi:hypothetical protein
MRTFELQGPEAHGPSPRYLFESVQLAKGDKLSEEEPLGEPSLLHLITPIGQQPTFLSLTPGVPMYNETEKPTSLGFLHLGADDSALWGAANPVSPAKLESAEVTVVRDTNKGVWSQLIGPTSEPQPGGNPFTKFPQPKTRAEENANQEIASIAPDHSGEGAWLAISSPENASLGRGALAMLAHLSSSGAVSERQTLPSAAEIEQGLGPKGAASKIACPAPGDCWLATSAGWLFHLSDGKQLPRAAIFDQAFPGLITVRPLDGGVPQVQPDAPPIDDSGLRGEIAAALTPPAEELATTQTAVPLPLLTHVRTRLLRRTTLELSFHLAARAQIRLVARRRHRVVARTPMRTFEPGDRKLLLLLNIHSWPTKLDLQTHALGPLPTTSIRGAATTTVGTGMRVLQRTIPPFSGPGLLP